MARVFPNRRSGRPAALTDSSFNNARYRRFSGKSRGDTRVGITCRGLLLRCLQCNVNGRWPDRPILRHPAMKRQWGFFSKAPVDRVLLPETGRSMVVVIIPELNGCSARESGHSDLKCQRVQSAISRRSMIPDSSHSNDRCTLEPAGRPIHTTRPQRSLAFDAKLVSVAAHTGRWSLIDTERSLPVSANSPSRRKRDVRYSGKQTLGIGIQIGC